MAEAQQRAQLNALLENLTEGVLIADASGRVLMVNDAARTILGLGDADLTTVAALERARRLTISRGALSEASSAASNARCEASGSWTTRCCAPDRTASSAASCRRARACETRAGNVAMAIVVFRDVTELRRLEQQRDDYVALISHDLRSPLSAITDVRLGNEAVHGSRPGFR